MTHLFGEVLFFDNQVAVEVANHKQLLCRWRKPDTHQFFAISAEPEENKD